MAGDCARATPCGEIAAGVATHKPYVHVAAGDYLQIVFIDETAGPSLTIVAEPNARLRPSAQKVVALKIAPADANPHDVIIRGLTIADTQRQDLTNGIGLQCSDAGATRLTLERVILDHNEFTGLVSDCTLTMDRSIVRNNLGGGVNLLGGTVTITNSLIDDNVGANFGGLYVGFNVSASSLIAFTTIAANTTTQIGAATGMRCDAIVAAHSNIIYGNGTLDVAGTCSFTYTDSSTVLPGTGNLSADPGLAADYRIDATSVAHDAAMPQSGIVTDLDGLPRPADKPDMGAYEVQ
jgi:hypothetical protein